MADEKITGKGLSILEDELFGLTGKDVKRILKKTEEELKATQAGLHNNLEKREKEFLERHLVSVQAQLTALSTSPKNVLTKIKYFYDRTAQLDREGMNKDAILDQLASEFPDIESYYGLLREKPWGYRLGQAILMTRTGRQFKSK